MTDAFDVGVTEHPCDRRRVARAPRVCWLWTRNRLSVAVWQIILRSVGYAVEAARTWFDVLARVVVSPPDALLVDLAQLDGRGVELCGEVRRLSGVPILVLSAVGDERQRVRALDAGAGDFVLSPFGVDELLARLRAVLRQPEELEGSTRLSVGGLLIDVPERRVARDGEDVPLTPLEFELVHVLACHHGRVVTDRQLVRALWGAGTGA